MDGSDTQNYSQIEDNDSGKQEENEEIKIQRRNTSSERQCQSPTATSQEENTGIEGQVRIRKKIGFTKFLEFPLVLLLAKSKVRTEPLIDYQQFILLTKDHHVSQLEEVVSKRETTAVEKQKRQLKREVSKQQRAYEKQEKIVQS